MTDRAIPGLVALYDTGQETERVNSYNPGACTGRCNYKRLIGRLARMDATH